jgi:hypothetical protein
MLGEYVFDIGSSKNFQHLQATLRHTVRPLATPEEIDDLMDGNVNWADLLGRWCYKSESPTPNLLELNDEQVVKATLLKKYSNIPPAPCHRTSTMLLRC